jgi:hypothetical protein
LHFIAVSLLVWRVISPYFPNSPLLGAIHLGNFIGNCFGIYLGAWRIGVACGGHVCGPFWCELIEKSVSLYIRVQRVQALDVFPKNLEIFLKNIFGAELGWGI